MLVSAFAEKVIEGYLFKDLENMVELQPKPGQDKGAVGYPMIMTICSGIEVLGALLYPNPIKKLTNNIGRDHFRHYWDNYLVAHKSSVYLGLAELVYSLVRHGVAHSFIAKGGVLVYKPRPSTIIPENLRHMNVDVSRQTISINPVEFFKDFSNSYFGLIKPIIFSSARNPLKNDMQARLNELLSSYEAQAKKEFEKISPEQTSTTTASNATITSKTHRNISPDQIATSIRY